MNLRPKPGETEEDILRQQNEFIQNKVKPAVQVLKCDDLASKISNNPNSDQKSEESSSRFNLIGSIIERTTLEPQNNINHRFSSGFPQVKRRQISTFAKKGSIFSQQNKKLKNDSTSQIEEMNISSNLNIPKCSYILSGKDKNDIHTENIETLAKMSEDEILDEQNKLLQSLDPKIIKFLQSKRKCDEREETLKMEETVENLDIDVEKIETAKEIIDVSENWLHFDKIETEKLQWMKNMEMPQKPDNGEPYEARFDFSGWLLPYIESEISEKNRILYHHGEEPGRPGYTLKELFQLCRSSVQQQKILALNTISRILLLHSTGVYDTIIDLPLEQIFFIIRVSLDDNSPAVLNASVKAMHHLFYNQIDENCLDSLNGFGLGTVQPMVTVQKDNKTKGDEREFNDQELAELDLVECLARTDILTRIRYVINTVKPSTETIIFCLELLIRLVRDSESILAKVYNCQDLFANIIQYFVPKIYKLENLSNYCYGKPVLQAIKLLRISASRRRLIAEDLIQKHQIMHVISSYISNNITDNITGVKIQTESYKLLSIFFHYNLGLDNYAELQPFLMLTLNYHFRNTNIDENMSYSIQNHFSCLVNVITEISRVDYNLVSDFTPLLMQCLAKYCSQVSQLTNFECGKLQIISSLLIAVTNITKYCPVQSDNLVFSLISSPGFNKITENIKLSSNLLCEYKTHKSAANFSSVEAALWQTSDHIIPCLNSKSCMPFLTALSYFIEVSDNTELILKFLQHKNIHKYLMLLKSVLKYNLASNWFTKIESQLLINIFKSSIKVRNLLVDSFLFYQLTVKCLSIFNIEQKSNIDYLLQNIVFNKQFYPNEVMLSYLTVTGDQDFILDILKDLDDIYKCYSEIMGLKKNVLSNLLTVDKNIGNIIPVDWIFSPIVKLYSEQQENELKRVDEKQQILIVTQCLQWICIFESYFPDLASLINCTDRFCRLSCVFLSSNTLFLDKNVHNVLEICLKLLIKPGNLKNLNFDAEIQGLNNFQDFYVQLLEQYQGVSYGDKLFANFILIPLTQKHNFKWRKIFWSEYMGVAQTINLDLNEVLINIEEFLNPFESDLSILKCYRKALVNNYLSRSPLLKFIANYHVDNYIKNKRM